MSNPNKGTAPTTLIPVQKGTMKTPVLTILLLALVVAALVAACLPFSPRSIVVASTPTSAFRTPTATGHFGTPTITPTPLPTRSTPYCPPNVVCE